MKTKNSDIVTKILLTIFAVLIVGTVIAWGSGWFTRSNTKMKNTTGKVDGKLDEMAEFDLNVYDGDIISGEQLVEIINTYKREGREVSVGVKTLGATAEVQYNYKTSAIDATKGTAEITPTPAATPTVPTSKGDKDYINPNGNFKGKIVRNANKQIVLIQFEQQK